MAERKCATSHKSGSQFVQVVRLPPPFTRYTYAAFPTPLDVSQGLFQNYREVSAGEGWEPTPDNFAFMVCCHVNETGEKAPGAGKAFLWRMNHPLRGRGNTGLPPATRHGPAPRGLPGGVPRRDTTEMRHCVYSYGNKCAAGTSRIFSIQDESGKRLATAEITRDVKSWNAAQVRGYMNARVDATIHAAAKTLAAEYQEASSLSPSPGNSLWWVNAEKGRRTTPPSRQGG